MEAMDALMQELSYQRELLHHLTASEIPALRMEVAFLRADVQAMEERLGVDGNDGGSPFVRSGINLPPLAVKWQNQPLCPCDSSTSDGEEQCDSESTAVSLEPNVWDCSVMVCLCGWRLGSELFGRFNIFMTAGLFIFNTLVQLLFVLAVKSMVDWNPYNDEAMLSKRLQEGQLYYNMDHKTMQSKAQQTCNLQSYSTLGQTVEFVSDYLQKSQDDQVMLSGRVICGLALVTWNISMFSEVRRAVQDLVFVILSLPNTNQVITNHRHNMLVIEGVPRCLKILSAILTVPRLIIACALLWYGMMYLTSTIELRDLLTNAVALEFIKTIDEMLFEAIMPRKLMGLVKSVKIRVHDGFLPHETHGGRFVVNKGGRGLGIQTFYVLLRLTVISAAIAVAYGLLLDPMVSFTERAYYEMCGKNTNFTWMMHPMTSVPVFASLDPYNNFTDKSGTSALRCFYAAQYEMLRMRAGFEPRYSRYTNHTLMTVLNGTHPLCWEDQDWSGGRPVAACPEHSLGYFNRLKSFGLDFYSSYYDCRDQDFFVTVLRATCLNSTFLQGGESSELAFFNDVRSCKDFEAKACHGTKRFNLSLAWMWQIQKVCPESCGFCHPNPESQSAGLIASSIEAEDRASYGKLATYGMKRL